MADVSVLILAAGKGTRMKSSLPKVLHPVGGIPMVERVVRSTNALKPRSICVVVGHGAEKVQDHLKATFPGIQFAVQKKIDGSGGAVRQASRWLKKQRGDVLIACGDAPLITPATFKQILSQHRKEKNSATVLTTLIPDPTGYGRIVRDGDNSVQGIVEHLDATADEREIREINTGTYCFNVSALSKALGRLKNDNAKKEFYLTDTLTIIRTAKGRIGATICANYQETQGINGRAELAQVQKALYQRTAARLMAQGVTLMDPDSCYIEDSVQVGPDTVIYPQTFLFGSTTIGSSCQIGPWAYIKDTKIENDVFFQASFSEQSIIRKGARIGPYARVRPVSEIGPNAHVGNFTEIKKSRLAEGVKANHLSYLGDAKIGKNVNIGAGTITCNYDGVRKSPTHIQDNAFIGSNSNLVAPLTVGANSVVGAGSTVTKDVPSWSLALERSPLLVKKDWVKRRKK